MQTDTTVDETTIKTDCQQFRNKKFKNMLLTGTTASPAVRSKKVNIDLFLEK